MQLVHWTKTINQCYWVFGVLCEWTWTLPVAVLLTPHLHWAAQFGHNHHQMRPHHTVVHHPKNLIIVLNDDAVLWHLIYLTIQLLDYLFQSNGFVWKNKKNIFIRFVGLCSLNVIFFWFSCTALFRYYSRMSWILKHFSSKLNRSNPKWIFNGEFLCFLLVRNFVGFFFCFAVGVSIEYIIVKNGALENFT